MKRAFHARLGWVGYVGILARIRDLPGTLPELAQRSDAGRDTLYRLIPSLHAVGRIHVSGWRLAPRSTLAIYSYGPGVDAPPPTTRPNGRPVQNAAPVRVTPSPEIIAFNAMLRCIDGQPENVANMMEQTGSHRDTIRRAIDAMVAENLAHLCLWEPRSSLGGEWVRNYTLGAGTPAKKPINKRANRRVSQRAWYATARRREQFHPLTNAFHPANALQAEAA